MEINEIYNCALNLNAIFEFIAKDDNNEIVEREITDGYNIDETEDKNVSKVIRELKSRGAGQRDTFRYDIVKMLILELFENEDAINSVSGNIAFNTLTKYNMIKNKNDE